VRALALHEDLIVVVSAIWQTTATFVRSGDEGFLIDSPVLPEELEALPSLAEQAGFPVSGLLCTHADWDHLLGRLAFPSVSLGAGEVSAARLAAEPGAPQRRLREFDAEHYVEGRPPLGLGGIQGLPVPGRLSLGGGERVVEIEMFPAPGHTSDACVLLLEWLGVLVCGDYLSPVEIPMLGASGSLDDYRGTLSMLDGLLGRGAIETVVPGHGRPVARARALELLAEDVAYLEALQEDGDAPLPEGRRTGEQRRIHAENVARVSGG
jgi:glyoxylase-like metal-dependent hydrolase (beta-lactamase superfamily II)